MPEVVAVVVQHYPDLPQVERAVLEVVAPEG
jgi:hypothetical protein